MVNKKFRTHRFEYVGVAPSVHGLTTYIQYQALQGPAGWIDQGPRAHIRIPWGRLAQADVTDHLDQTVRRLLVRAWTIEADDTLW